MIEDEIKETFAALNKQFMSKINLGSESLYAYSFYGEDGYGVLFPIGNEKNIDEKFQNVILDTRFVSIEGDYVWCIRLYCKNKEYKNEFALICANFVDLGVNNKNRTDILNNPYVWFEKWKLLIGNKKVDLKAYDLLGELYVLLCLIKKGKKVFLSSTHMSSHDIEGEDESYEVKSTIVKSENNITISSSYQLVPVENKKLNLVFCHFEENENGYSIDDIFKELLSLNYKDSDLEDYIDKLGYQKGKKERNKKFRILSCVSYVVDESFPKIIPSSFKFDKIPEGVISYTYTIDLAGIKGDNL